MTYFNTNSLINYCHHMYRANINFLKERFQGVPEGNMRAVNPSKQGRRREQDLCRIKESRAIFNRCGRAKRMAQLLRSKKQRQSRLHTTAFQITLIVEGPKEVTTIRYYRHSKSGYPVCPACGYAMEREYQKHCEECGQRLAWNQFCKNNIIVQRIEGTPVAQLDLIRGRKGKEDASGTNLE